MSTANRYSILSTPREERTPESDVTQIMCNMAVAFANCFDPPGSEDEFLERCFHGILADDSYCGDECANEYSELVNATDGRDLNLEFQYAFVISCIYCVEAIKAENSGNHNEAWSFVSDAQYWSGVVFQTILSGRNLIDALADRSRSGGKARSAKYEPLREMVKNLVAERQYPSARNAAKNIAPSIVARSIGLGIPFSEMQSEETVKTWLKDIGFSGKRTT